MHEAIKKTYDHYAVTYNMDWFDCKEGRLISSQTVDLDNWTPSAQVMADWKEGNRKLYTLDTTVLVSVVVPMHLTDPKEITTGDTVVLRDDIAHGEIPLSEQRELSAKELKVTTTYFDGEIIEVKYPTVSYGEQTEVVTSIRAEFLKKI